MKGLELAKAYYETYGEPMLKKDFTEIFPRLAAGLAGDGSECLGFDDDISTDHDFGPGFCIWLSDDDYRRHGQALQAAYDKLPQVFASFPARNVTEGGAGRVGVMSVQGFYSRFIGSEQPPASLERWLFLPEEKLAAVTAGEVFYDGSGEFSKVRNALLEYYPEDVRIKKIAARAVSMAQSGQYNYARCMRRDEYAAAQIAISLFIKSTMSMWYLLVKAFAPYYKWMYRGLSEIAAGRERTDSAPNTDKKTDISQETKDNLARVLLLINELALRPDQSDVWKSGMPEGADPYENRMDAKVDIAEDICSLTRKELERQGLSDLRESFLERHAWEIMKRIKDPGLRSMHVLAG